MELKGNVWKYGDNISTDLIAPGKYFHLRTNLEQLAEHVLEDLDSNFAKRVAKGDFIVAGRNFGLGSSREHAPTIIKIAGVRAILAKSFARIFFRNAVNIGLPVIICDTDGINNKDVLSISLQQGTIHNITQNVNIDFTPLPKIMTEILNNGGLVSYVKMHGDIVL